MPVDFDYKALGKLLVAEIDAKGCGYRPACAEIGISISSVSRLKRGAPTAAHTVFSVCAWLGVRPDGFTCEVLKQDEPKESASKPKKCITKASGFSGLVERARRREETGRLA